MKKLLLPLFCLLFLISCEKESSNDLLSEQEIHDNSTATSRSPAPKIDVCHYDAENDTWHVINISQNAWPAHEGHGDVQLIDTDGDGWVTSENECGLPVDCDDTDDELTDNCSTSCVEGELEFILPDGTTLYVYPTDTDRLPWGEEGNDIDGLANITTEAGANADFNGAANTAAIVAHLGNWNGGDYGANICATLSAETGCEWYLPAAGELNALYNLGLGGYPVYWSSSEVDEDGGWGQLFGFGGQNQKGYKELTGARCRCVRR